MSLIKKFLNLLFPNVLGIPAVVFNYAILKLFLMRVAWDLFYVKPYTNYFRLFKQINHLVTLFFLFLHYYIELIFCLFFT